jgi:Na+/H+-dicarboxylate symporter
MNWKIIVVLGLLLIWGVYGIVIWISERNRRKFFRGRRRK